VTEYTVKYKKLTDSFWKTIKNVKGDGVMEKYPVPTRYFILNDETKYEIPIEGMIFKFSKERYELIKQNMEKEVTP
jgi:hypothetical protein